MQKSNKISRYIYIDQKVYYAVTLTLASEIDLLPLTSNFIDQEY